MIYCTLLTKVQGNILVMVKSNVGKDENDLYVDKQVLSNTQ
ncbi:hypothetical protein [Companilactobacillus zhachilii]|nr:hypothetical protein [Companilactobacillus zhachilii]